MRGKKKLTQKLRGRCCFCLTRISSTDTFSLSTYTKYAQSLKGWQLSYSHAWRKKNHFKRNFKKTQRTDTISNSFNLFRGFFPLQYRFLSSYKKWGLALKEASHVQCKSRGKRSRAIFLLNNPPWSQLRVALEQT